MRSLLKKDIYLMWKVAPAIPFIMLMCSLLCLRNQSHWGILMEIGILAVGMVVLGIEVDEGNRWQVYQDTLPLSRSTAVREKYLLLCLSAFAGTVMQMLFNTVYGLLKGGRIEAGNILFLPMIIFVSAMVFGSVQLPFYFRYGSVRGRIVYRITMAFGLVAVATLSQKLKIPKHIPLHPTVLFGILFGIGLVVCVVSYLISVRVYRKRDLR